MIDFLLIYLGQASRSGSIRFRIDLSEFPVFKVGYGPVFLFLDKKKPQAKFSTFWKSSGPETSTTTFEYTVLQRIEKFLDHRRNLAAESGGVDSRRLTV